MATFDLDHILTEVRQNIIDTDLTMEEKVEDEERKSKRNDKTDSEVEEITTTPGVTLKDGPDPKMFENIKESFKVPKNFLFKEENTFFQMIRNIMRKEWILVTGPTGCGKTHLGKVLAKAMDMDFFSINLGDTSNPASKLLGHIAYDPEQGTHFVRSQFVEAIQSEKPTLIMLDEITRDRSQELQNILIPVLDEQRMLILDEERPPATIKVSFSS